MKWLNRFRKKEEETEDIELTEEKLEKLNQEAYDTSFYSELEELDSEEELDLMTKKDSESHILGLYNEGLNFDEIERIEYRRDARLAQQMDYQSKVQDRADFIQAMFTPNMIIGYIVTFLLSTIYLWLTTGQIAFSMIVSLIGSVVFVYWFIFQENKLDIKQKELEELEQLAREITLQADVASNTYEVIGKMAEKYDTGRVGNDVNMMYQNLHETTELDTSRFSLYNFTPIEIFMRNLEIWYREGSDTKKVFTKSVHRINFELLKRDELRKLNKQALNMELVTASIGAFFPIVTRIAARSVYTVFLGKPVLASVLMLLLYVGVLSNIVKLKKLSLDIDVR